MLNNRHKRRSGFMLMEAILAFTIFGIAVTGIILALHSTASLSQQVIKAQWIKQEAQNLLSEVITSPLTGNDFERDDLISIDEFTQARILVEPHEAVDQDDAQLSDLYSVSVTIYWDNDGTRDEQTFSTIHYSKMFSSQQRR